jgi:hypothetical protein
MCVGDLIHESSMLQRLCLTVVCPLPCTRYLGLCQIRRLPHQCKAIDSKWIFKVKRNPNNTVKRYKVHLVGKVFGPVPQWDVCPTTKWAALCAILALTTLMQG